MSASSQGFADRGWEELLVKWTVKQRTSGILWYLQMHSSIKCKFETVRWIQCTIPFQVLRLAMRFDLGTFWMEYPVDPCLSTPYQPFPQWIVTSEIRGILIVLEWLVRHFRTNLFFIEERGNHSWLFSFNYIRQSTRHWSREGSTVVKGVFDLFQRWMKVFIIDPLSLMFQIMHPYDRYVNLLALTSPVIKAHVKRLHIWDSIGLRIMLQQRSTLLVKLRMIDHQFHLPFQKRMRFRRLASDSAPWQFFHSIIGSSSSTIPLSIWMAWSLLWNLFLSHEHTERWKRK